MRAERRSNRHYVYRDGRYEDQTGAAIAGGILGFMLGAAIAGSSQDRDYYNTHRNDGGWRSRCSKAYRSFDAGTGTYMGADGYRHYCTR
ncbi:MAG: BA14K family protein [Caulobacteraceae bacterium]